MCNVNEMNLYQLVEAYNSSLRDNGLDYISTKMLLNKLIDNKEKVIELCNKNKEELNNLLKCGLNNDDIVIINKNNEVDMFVTPLQGIKYKEYIKECV